jgi:hypothetical protein
VAGAEGEIKTLKVSITEQKGKTREVANQLASVEKEFAAILSGIIFAPLVVPTAMPEIIDIPCISLDWSPLYRCITGYLI